MKDYEIGLRERLAFIARKLFEAGLVEGTNGNISAKISGTNEFLIKPSGYSLNEIEPNFFIKIDYLLDKIIDGNDPPSIETPMHSMLYKRRLDVGGIVYVHPHYSTIFSILNKEIIPMGLEVIEAPSLVKGISISKYAKPGSIELAINVTDSLIDKVASLLPYHGLTAIGKTIEEAAQNAITTEKMAKLHYDVLLVGKPRQLPSEIINQMIKLAKEKDFLI
ncbi:class II aldolase/adducin family protein [Candidatus Bathyarchaeota archaeon]|nr:class II aldolase/adducin family protein [Candidatus Bathyarchaeota archaeon]